MAQPEIPLEIWAEDDVTLPNTGQLNKDRPIDDLWSKGYDRGQKPANEEYNYVLNMLCQWTSWIAGSEGLNAYLPKQGTKITFNGRATGVVDFNGSQEATVELSIFAIDNATPDATANRLALRDANGGISFRNHINILNGGGGAENDNSNLYFRDTLNNIRATITWQGADGLVNFNLGTPGTNEVTLIQMGQYYVNMRNPRATEAQENLGNALTRKDYVDQRVSSVTDTMGTGWFKSGATGYLVQSFSGEGSSGGQVVRTATFPVPFTSRVDSIVVSWKDTNGQPDYPPRILSNTNTTVEYVADGNGNVSFIATGV